MAGNVTISAVHLDRGAIYRLLNDPRGPVGIAMMRLGRRIVQQAKATAPVQSGKLKSSIHISLWPGPRLSMEITANTSYAYYVHEGTKAHKITGNPLLKFPSKRRGGKIVIAKTVNYPGTKANPFLTKAMRQAIAMRV